MDKTQLLVGLGVMLFAAGLVGVMVRRNALVMLMCMELMLNGVNLTLVSFAQQTGATEGAVLVFLVAVGLQPIASGFSCLHLTPVHKARLIGQRSFARLPSNHLATHAFAPSCLVLPFVMAGRHHPPIRAQDG